MPSSGAEAQLPFTETGMASHSSSATSGLDINGLPTAEAKAKVSQGRAGNSGPWGITVCDGCTLKWLRMRPHMREQECWLEAGQIGMEQASYVLQELSLSLLSVCLPFCLSVCLSAHLPVYLSARPSVFLSTSF